MVTDQKVKRLFKLIHTEKNIGIAAAKEGMDLIRFFSIPVLGQGMKIRQRQLEYGNCNA